MALPGFENTKQGKTTPTVLLSLNFNLLTLTSGEHSVIPYPFSKVIPISLKNSPISGLIGAPPQIISFKFPPKASCIDLNSLALKSIPVALKPLLIGIIFFSILSLPVFCALFQMFL